MPSMPEDREPDTNENREPGADESPTSRRFRVGDRVRRADSRPELVAAARFIRRVLPGDDRYGDALSTSGQRMPERIGRLMSEARAERESAARELGLGALQAWQALSEAQGRGRGTVEVAILFTDIVEFSSWALEVGDESALEMLREVAAVEDDAISSHHGKLVKRLGDGSMSAFGAVEDAVRAALGAQRGLLDVNVEGHSPELRAGVHLGRPRRVGADYLGVDVNIAARVGECASGGEVLVSEPARRALGDADFRFDRERLLSESGAPRDLAVSRVRSR